jgi:hypothetical protein
MQLKHINCEWKNKIQQKLHKLAFENFSNTSSVKSKPIDVQRTFILIANSYNL